MEKQSFINSILSGENKKPLPILSYPGLQLNGHKMHDVLNNSVLQAQTAYAVAKRCDSAAAVMPMDLSVEAEAFGAEITESENSVPSVNGILVTNYDDAVNLAVPKIGEKRTSVFVNAVIEAKKLITDRPVLAGTSAPFSLAARLMGITDIMLNCYDEPEAVELLTQKCTDFIIAFIKAYKNAGADGVILAEPVSGLLSPALESEFSAPYIKQIADAVCDDEFSVIYHNCGDGVSRMTESIFANGCDAYHFGNAADIAEMLTLAPNDKLIMGNLDPVELFKNGTADDMKKAVESTLAKCGKYSNFVLSSGCDIPAAAKWENIDMFYKASDDFYKGN